MSDSVTEYPTVRAVLQIVARRAKDPLVREGLARVEADLFATVTAHAVIWNDGHIDWHARKSGELTRKVATSFDRIGLPEVAEALRASLQAFPGGAPPDDQAARQRFINDHRAELEASFEKLDEIVRAADWNEAAMAYIDAHRDDLAAIAPEYATILRLH